MPLINLSHRVCTIEEAEILEAGCKKNSWSLVTDGRISSPATGSIGPVAYLGPVRKKEGPDGTDLPANDGIVMFFDEDDAVVAMLSNVDPTDLILTQADFLEQCGASISVMKTKRPLVDIG